MSRLTSVLIVFALALVALGIYDITRDKADESGRGTDAGIPSSAARTPAAGIDLTAAQAPLGTVVTSGGATLYRFEKDTPKPPKSYCAGPCATTWPPLLARGGTPAVSGVDPALVGTVTRDDGSEQVTLGGWPLYRYAQDGPGETTGEGVGGTWHAVGPAGKPAAGAPAPVAPTTVQAPAPVEAPAPASASKPRPVRKPVPTT